MTKPNVLFLADTTHPAQAVLDHIQAITKNANIHWHVVNPLICKTVDRFDFTCFDAIGLHYSVKLNQRYYVSHALKRKMMAYPGTKFIFLQDEYQNVTEMQTLLYEIGFDVLFTLVKQELLDKAYPDPRLRQLKKITVLTGYVPENMTSIMTPPIKERSIDVSYRGRPCEYWLGQLAQDKQRIATEFLSRTTDLDLRLDISLEEADRVYGDAWLQLLMRSKAVLGTESGASIWDFDATVRNKTIRFLSRHKQADFDTVYEQVLKPYDGKIPYNAVSPRIFEAAATKTPMILFPGEYSGVCKPHEHYIVLEKDFSNLKDVLSTLHDDAYLQALADRTHADLIASGRYSQTVFSELVGRALLEQIDSQTTDRLASEVTASIDKCIKKHQSRNRFRRLYTEGSFILKNFWNLLRDPRHTIFTKCDALGKGLKRYIAYLLPRFQKKSRS